MVHVSRTTIDSGHRVSGVINVYNPAPIPAPLASVSDELLPGGIIAVNCGVSFPYMLAPNASLTCTYATPLGNADERRNIGRAALANGSAGLDPERALVARLPPEHRPDLGPEGVGEA